MTPMTKDPVKKSVWRAEEKVLLDIIRMLKVFSIEDRSRILKAVTTFFDVAAGQGARQ